MQSLKIKLPLVYAVLGLTGLLLTLAFFYVTATNSIYAEMENRADVLSEEIIYSVEILAEQQDTASIQKLVEKSSALEGVTRIFIVDRNQKILAHTDRNLIGSEFTSPLIDEVFLKRKQVNQNTNKLVAFVHPIYSSADPTRAESVLWVEIDTTRALAQLQQTFGVIVLASLAILVPFYIAQYFTIKKVIIDRLHDMETGIAQYTKDGQASAVMVDKSFGTEDEINALAQAYNYLITSLHNSQKNLKSERDFALHIMESIREGLTITNAEGQFEYVNPAYANFIGLVPEQLIGLTPETVTHPGDHEASSQAWELRKNGNPSSYETRLISKDGSEINVLISSVPRFHDGEFAGSIAVITNISQRARLERMKSDFINRASHELRTPLATAILMANLLEGASSAEESQQFITILKQQLNRQHLLLNDLLVAGRIESRKYEVRLALVNIIPIIEEAIASVQPQADTRQIIIQLESTASQLMSTTDGQALSQVLLNMLSNAVKFSHPKGIVELIVRKLENSIMIAVRDYGIGIPANDLPHITSRFFRAQNATQMEIPGTGIGLYIIKEIMDALQGSMQIDSIENQGTTTTIYLPLTSQHS